MFDWARGSMLRELDRTGFFSSGKHEILSPWLKDWSVPWFLGAVKFQAGLRVLDVGSSYPAFAHYLHKTYGCEAHALDFVPGTTETAHFGLNAAADYPGVVPHYGRAGDDPLPADHFDIIYCNSVIEHTYDTKEALNPDQPLAHLDVLRDLVRMARPGGLLLMNWDVYVDGVPHHLGWEYELDFWLLQHCGMRLADPTRRIRSARYIYNHPDSLFFGRAATFTLARPAVHATSINAIWRKPGGDMPASLIARPELRQAYFPPEETDPTKQYSEDPIASAEIDARFRKYIESARQALGARLVERDA